MFVYENISDEELAVIAKTDVSAVSELISRYMHTVDLLAKKISFTACDDLKQEGCMALVKAIQTYDPHYANSVKFSTYANACVKNKMLSSLKKNSYEENSDISGNEIEDYGGIEEDNIPENIVIERERMEELMENISQILSPLEWQVFQLFLRGMSYDQIALSSGLTEKAANNAMQRVRRKLKALLK